MVKYVYTGKVDDVFEDLDSLMNIGSKYMIQGLANDCGKKLARTISASNVLQDGVMAELYGASDLVKSCAEFVFKNMEVLGENWKEELKNSPKFLMAIVESAKEG